MDRIINSNILVNKPKINFGLNNTITGVEWEEKTINIQINTIRNSVNFGSTLEKTVTFKNSIYGIVDTVKLITTTDGVTWEDTGFEIQSKPDPEFHNEVSILFTEGNFLWIGTYQITRHEAGSHRNGIAEMYKSSDGKTWEKVIKFNSLYIPLFVFNGQYYLCRAETNGVIKYLFSYNSVDWREETIPQNIITLGGFEKVCGGNNVFVGLNKNVYPVMSNDGVKWKEISIKQYFTNLIFLNNTFHLFNDNTNEHYVSKNGETWSTIPIQQVGKEYINSNIWFIKNKYYSYQHIHNTGTVEKAMQVFIGDTLNSMLPDKIYFFSDYTSSGEYFFANNDDVVILFSNTDIYGYHGSADIYFSNRGADFTRYIIKQEISINKKIGNITNLTLTSNELMQATTTINGVSIGQHIANDILTQYKNGKATINCTVNIGDDTPLFAVGEIAKVYGFDGKSVLRNRDGTDKRFYITSSELRYNGQIKQILEMVEVIESNGV